MRKHATLLLYRLQNIQLWSLEIGRNIHLSSRRLDHESVATGIRTTQSPLISRIYYCDFEWNR